MSARKKPRREGTGGAASYARHPARKTPLRGNDGSAPSLQRLLREEVQRFGPTWLGRDGQERERSYVALVEQAARRMERATGEPWQSFTGPGFEGLAGAAPRFDRTRGVPFSAFAQLWVTGAMRRSLHHGPREPGPQGDEPRWSAAQRAEVARRLHEVTEPGSLARYVVEYRLLANGEHQALEQIGRRFNVSREYVRKVEAGLIKKAGALPASKESRAAEVADLFSAPGLPDEPEKPLAKARDREEVKRLSAEVTRDERRLTSVASNRQCRWDTQFCPHNPPCKGA